MKKSHFLWGMLCIALIQVPKAKAQERTKEENDLYCKRKYISTSHLLDLRENAQKVYYQQIQDALKSCPDTQTDDARFVNNVLIIKTQSEGTEQALEQIRQVAETGHAKAAYFLGAYYQKVIQIEENFIKALKWYQKAAEQRHQKAIFKLGYLHLKGLGNVPQDYSLAIKYFKNSTYPMASHWLAKLQHFGYGMVQDKTEAKKLLSQNYIANSKSLIAQIEQQENKPNRLSNYKHNNIQDCKDMKEDYFSTYSLHQKYKGRVLQYEWSGKQLIKTFPIAITFKENGKRYKIEWQNNEYEGTTTVLENSLLPDSLVIPVEALLPDHPAQSVLDYNITKINLYQNPLSEDGLTMELEGWINNWKETLPPFVIILQSDEIGQNIDEQKNHFIKTYPNPFVEDITISFDLPYLTYAKINLQGITQPTIQKVIAQEKTLKKGQHQFQLEGKELPKGLYLITVETSQKKYNKYIIKN